MFKELNKYNFVEKSKSELEADRIFTDIQNKWFVGLGYETIYKLGAIHELKAIAKTLEKYKTIDLNTVLTALSTFKESEDVSDLVNMILEEFDYKENEQ
jgi:hypothetical protein